MPERVVVVGAGHPDTAALTAGMPVWAAQRIAATVPGAEPFPHERLGAVVEAVAALPSAAIVASGDPGFFGIVRLLAERFGREVLDVHPMPSSVSLAFARLGLPWDDAVVVSLHGRSLDDALALVARTPKCAVLTGPATPPAVLLPAAEGRAVAVLVRLGEPGEDVVVGGQELLEREWPEPNVVVLWTEPGVGPVGRTWGLPDDRWEHRAGMLTRSEVRAIVLARLGPWPGAVLWDLGAGSGSVGTEAASFGARVFAVEQSPDDCVRIRANAAGAVTVVEGKAPDVLDGLPDPDLVFVGGGGPEVVAAAAERRPERIVVTLTRIDLLGAVEAALDGYDVESSLVAVSHVRDLAGGRRLDAANPVLVVSAARS